MCKKENCRQVYIGESQRTLKARIDDHRGYVVNNQLTKATGEHFNLPGHSLADLSVKAIERAKVNSALYCKERIFYQTVQYLS